MSHSGVRKAIVIRRAVRVRGHLALPSMHANIRCLWIDGSKQSPDELLADNVGQFLVIGVRKNRVIPNYCMLSTMGRGYSRSLRHGEGIQRKGRRMQSAQQKNEFSPFLRPLRQTEPVMWLSYFLYLFFPGSKGESLDVQFSLPRGRLSGHYSLMNFQSLQVVHLISCFVSSSGK